MDCRVIHSHRSVGNEPTDRNRYHVTSRTIGVLAFHDVLTSELAGPVEVLGSAITSGDLPDTTLLVVAAGDRDVRTHEGLVVVADTTIHECPDLDVLVVPGAADMSPILDDVATVDFVARQGRTVQALASHCAGAFLAGAAGLLDGRRATTYAGGHADLAAAVPAAIVVESDVVVDGSLISSGAGTLSYLGALELLRELTDEHVARRVATELSLDRLAAHAPGPGA